MHFRRSAAALITFPVLVASVAVGAGPASAGDRHGHGHRPAPAPAAELREVACPEVPDLGGLAADLAGDDAASVARRAIRPVPAPALPSVPTGVLRQLGVEIDDGGTPVDDPLVDAPAGQPRCGLVPVPLHHDDPEGGTIEVAVAVVPATDPEPGADPLVLLGGGPGEKIVELLLPAVTLGADTYAPLHRSRDLVLVDQRGVGLSRPALECPEVTVAALTGDAVRRQVVPTLDACQRRLRSEGIDLSAFHTANNVRDLDLVRQALGAERVHLFGTSYGARLAWQAARIFPDRLASLVLSSPIPASENWTVDAPRSFGNVVRRVLDACAADPACAAEHPDLAAVLDRTLDDLRRNPVEVATVDPITGEPATTTVNHETVAVTIFSLFYVPGGPQILPGLISELRDGDYEEVFGGASAPVGAQPPEEPEEPEPVEMPSFFSTGMQFSFLCAEEARYVNPLEQAVALRRGGPIGRALWTQNPALGPNLQAICNIWDVDKAPREVFRPVVTSVPTFVVTGEWDQITPPSYGRTVRRAARDGQYLEVPGGIHGALWTVPCGFDLVAAFTDDPTAPVDTSCVPPAPPFTEPEEAPAEPGPELETPVTAG